MAPDLDDAHETSLSQIVDGFAALSDEYKHLAEKHHVLEANLAAATDELALLKKRSGDQQKEGFLNVGGTVPIKPRHNLSEWLIKIRGETPAVQETLSRIREAEVACYGAKNRLDECQMSRTGSSLRLPTSFKGSVTKPGRNRARVSNANMAELERDFTTSSGVAGQLGCPFAPKTDANVPEPHTPQRQELGTPLSAGSLTASGNKQSRKSSFNDPMRPTINGPTINGPTALSTVASEDGEGSGSAACPIRFLQDHSPEEVAKYFEQHKHEIPRSHEVCVKRFQGDENSVKQLDAKYGNLVSMIQGLGQKHQPMLPENHDKANSQPEEDRKSAIKVRSWANAVSEAAPEGSKDQPDKTRAQSEGVDGEERVSHFDRPLKEIRVGESPSRPWGVPIPSKYLDRALSPDNKSGREQSPPAPVKMNGPMAVARPDVDLEEVPEKAKPIKQTRGRCPFDHTKGATGLNTDAGVKEKDNVASVAHAPAIEKEETKAGVQRQDFYREETPKAKVTDSTTLHESTSESGQAPNIINTGTIFAADWKYLNSKMLDNRGTLIIGYDPPRFAGAKPL